MINEGQGTVREEGSAIKDRIEGNVKDAYGSVTGNETLEREGENQAAYGKVREQQNQMLTGLFNDRESAERACVGYAPRDTLEPRAAKGDIEDSLRLTWLSGYAGEVAFEKTFFGQGEGHSF